MMNCFVSIERNRAADAVALRIRNVQIQRRNSVDVPFVPMQPVVNQVRRRNSVGSIQRPQRQVPFDIDFVRRMNQNIENRPDLPMEVGAQGNSFLNSVQSQNFSLYLTIS